MPFKKIFALLLRKSCKSLHSVLSEYLEEDPPSASAFSQARRKFRHTIFIELLKTTVIDVMYSDDDYENYKGHRLLAIDCSNIRLPNSENIRDHFGVVKNTSKRGYHVEGKVSVLYDVLNDIPLDAHIEKARVNEIKLADKSLDHLTIKDILIGDRGYGSYDLFKEVMDRGANFVIRCSKTSYHRQHNLYTTGEREVIVELKRRKAKSPETEDETIKVRFVRIELESGEVEILATSLLDTEKYPYEDFQALYYERWKIETYFKLIKDKLNLENFTGKSVESVFQDFWATLLMTGLEALISLGANEDLREKESKYPQKVNKAVSFNVIKRKFVDLLENPPENFIDEITELLMKNPTLVRKNRAQPPRTNKGAARLVRSANYHKCLKKQVF